MHLILLLIALVSAGQRPTDVVKWSAKPPAAAVVAGESVVITLTAKIQDGWKLYAFTQPDGGPVPLAIAIGKDAPVTLVRRRIGAPQPKVQKDVNFDVDTHYYENVAAFTVPVQVPRAASGKVTVPLDVTFQACGAEICLRPFTERVTVNINIAKRRVGNL